jgi:altronate dehydratase small subunit
MMTSAIVVDPADNVATALEPLAAGNTINIEIGNQVMPVVLRQPIPFGHKLALTGIPVGGAVIKYGETIGLATHPIVPGEHVHVHNVDGRRGRGDLR